MTTREIQNVSLNILVDVDRYCRQHNIRYSLAYGSLIGAVRHKGFIPWDDDIDIIMPRPDFIRFMRGYKKDGKYPSTDAGESHIAFGRVYENQKTLSIDRIPWQKEKYGVWIDIFPIDSVDDDRAVFESIANKALHLYRRQLRRRKMKAPFWHKNTKSKFRTILNLFVRKNAKFFSREIIRLATIHAYGSTKHCGQLCCPDNAAKEYFPMNVMDEYIDLEFEGNKFMAIKEYDTVLRETYDDYMQLPAEKDRVSLHLHTKFYWKK